MITIRREGNRGEAKVRRRKVFQLVNSAADALTHSQLSGHPHTTRLTLQFSRNASLRKANLKSAKSLPRNVGELICRFSLAGACACVCAL